MRWRKGRHPKENTLCLVKSDRTNNVIAFRYEVENSLYLVMARYLNKAFRDYQGYVIPEVKQWCPISEVINEINLATFNHDLAQKELKERLKQIRSEGVCTSSNQ